MTFQHPDSRPNQPPSNEPRATGPTQPAAGWYPDPVTGVGLRWWDGAAWTDHTNRAGVSNSMVTPPPIRGSGGGLSPVGEWFGSLFRLTASRAGHLFPLVVLLSLAPGIPVAFLTYLAFRDVTMVIDQDEQTGVVNEFSIDGFEPSRLLPVAAATVLSYALSLLLSTATIMQIERASSAEPQRWDESLRQAVRRVPRVFGVTLLVGLMLVFVIALVVVLNAVLAVSAPIALLLTVPAAVFVVAWSAIRLSLATTNAALAPKGIGSISESLRLTSGKSWPLFGRFLLLLLVLLGVQIVSSLATAPVTAILGPDTPDFTTSSETPLIDLMGGSLPLYLFSQLVGILAGGVATALLSAGLVGLYRDLGGRLVSGGPSDVQQFGVDEA